MNEASDRVSDAEAAKPVLEVYRGERRAGGNLYPEPQFRRNRVECGPLEELDARNRCRKGRRPDCCKCIPKCGEGVPKRSSSLQLKRGLEYAMRSPKMGGMPVRTARGVEFWGEYRTYPGFWGGFTVVPWIRAQTVAISRRNEGEGRGDA
ncbi:hypothetical protein FB451DRAFT_1162002 [Mycena latifolia]|nr:hypothetical protein FB451DRAFT_1162002 [Mycena latifolia]